MAVTAQADEVHRAISTAVDPAFYRTVNDDLPRDVDPLRHYLDAGWREGRDPAPWFSVEAYLAANADVRRAGTEPLFHFLTVGKREGREAVPSRHAERYLAETQWAPEPWSFEALTARPAPKPPPAEPPAPTEPVEAVEAVETPAAGDDRELVAGAFEAAWYLAANPDVAAAGTDPLDHFLMAGWREGRDPAPWFSVKDYLETYPDIAAAGINPFAHYLKAGRAEGRIARHELGFRYDLIARLTPVEDRLAAAVRATAGLKLEAAAALAKGLAGARSGLADLHVTFSHDDYTATFGGMQLCLQREEARLAELGIDHLHLYPARAWPVVREGESGALGVLLNGRRLGVFAPQTVRSALAKAAGRKPRRRSFAIHSLLGHSADETADLLEALGLKAGFFWLHDFASLCAGFHLLRNDVEDCAAPPPGSAACGVCAYGPLRARHLAAHRRLFERLSLTVVAPSQTTLAFWRSSWDFPAAEAVVLPHAELIERGPAPASRRKRPFRLAFVGMPVPLKGWPIFRELARRHADDRRYEFLHVGGQDDPSAPAAFHPVVVSEAKPRAMQEALEALEVDAALIWPLCRETFSFTAYEAAAAGAAVITGPDSGNVAAFVAETGLGRVLADEAALAEALESGELLALARGKRKAKLYDLKFSALTVDLLRTA